MWTRKALKTKAKNALRVNYWKCVLVGLIVAVVLGGAGANAGLTFNLGSSALFSGGTSSSSQSSMTLEELESLDYDELGSSLDDSSSFDNFNYDELDALGEDASIEQILDAMPENEYAQVDVDLQGDNGESVETLLAVLLVLLPVLFLFALLAVAVAIASQVFLLNPLELGTKRFFTYNLNRKAEIKELAYGYDHDYLQTVKTLFIRDLKLIGWTLLFIIPGIVKGYEYRMVPYLIADDPSLTTEEAFAESRRLMTGNKFKAFVLDLSFIGWNILNICTLGILGIFYVGPYRSLTNAALYEALRYGDGAPVEAGLPEAPEAPQAPETSKVPGAPEPPQA